MKKISEKQKLALALSALGLILGVMAFNLMSQQPAKKVKASRATNRWIVVARPQIKADAALKRIPLLKRNLIKRLPLVNGMAIQGSPGEIQQLRNRGEILSIEKDSIHHASPIKQAALAATQPPQRIDWGVARVRSTAAWVRSRGRLVKIGVLDTGISIFHPDLAVAGGINTSGGRTLNDGHGHGSHVAGAIRATNNKIGVIGAAHLARTYSVKVLNDRGFGYTSDIIEGLHWAMTNGIQVVNMSFGSYEANLAFQTAISAAYAQGMLLVAAAGNESTTRLLYPAGYKEVIAVSATDNRNVLASFSNRGNHIDFGAPGVTIRSTYKSSSYALLSGTSMSSPHVTGVAALGLACWTQRPSYMRSQLNKSVTDLGKRGKDAFYGYGLPNALKLVNTLCQ